MHLPEQAGFNDAVLGGLELPARDGDDAAAAAAADAAAAAVLLGSLFIMGKKDNILNGAHIWS